MTLVPDAAPLIALADRRDRLHSAVERVLREEPGELVLPAPVTAEVDYLLSRRLGRAARLAFIEDLAAGRFVVAHLEPDEYGVITDLERRYERIDTRLADLSVVAAAHRHRTRRLLTFDEGHFRVLRPLDGGRFTLLPADEPGSWSLLGSHRPRGGLRGRTKHDAVLGGQCRVRGDASTLQS